MPWNLNQWETTANSNAETSKDDRFMDILLLRQQGGQRTDEPRWTACANATFATIVETDYGIAWITSATNRGPTDTNDEKRSFR